MITELHIGPMNYKVSEKPRLIGNNGDGASTWLNGNIKYHDCTITIEAENAPDMKIAALWHEALHGILAQAGHTEQPETLILALGYGLVALVRDNPELVKLTQEEPNS